MSSRPPAPTPTTRRTGCEGQFAAVCACAGRAADSASTKAPATPILLMTPMVPPCARCFGRGDRLCAGATLVNFRSKSRFSKINGINEFCNGMRIMADLAPAPAQSNRTVVSVAYDRLRRDIMNGVLEPGQKLKFNDLSEAYGVGVGTLREALHKLAADGLVDAEERRGFTVEQVSSERMADAAAVRIL